MDQKFIKINVDKNFNSLRIDERTKTSASL